jgi:2-polyprenyl-3-methyl-5-hydroxy-6-metoxy-1,4-benzoquinol methylase
MKKIKCHNCNAINVKKNWLVRQIEIFANQNNKSEKTAWIYQCKNCDLLFKNINDDAIDYEIDNLSGGWDGKKILRNDKDIVYKFLDKFYKDKNTKILDYGCFKGDFLSGLKDYEKYGVEINPYALEFIRKEYDDIKAYKNLELLGPKKFDVIVIIDVIEHVKNVEELMLQLSERLEFGGALIISTGDPSTLLARINRYAWWYWSFPEHISFINLKFIERFCCEKNLKLENVIKYKYERISLMVKIKLTFLYFMALITNNLYFRMLEITGKKIVSSVGYSLSRDHIIYIIKK